MSFTDNQNNPKGFGSSNQRRKGAGKEVAPNGQPIDRQFATEMASELGAINGRVPQEAKKRITAVRRVFPNSGAITDVQFDDGTTATIEQAIAMAEADVIAGVNTGVNVEGEKTLRSNRDDDPTNNLSNLPTF